MTTAGAPVPAEPAAGAPVIDAHQHFWDLSAHHQPWLASDPELKPLLRNFTLADLAPLAAAEGVTATVVVQTVEESWETPELLALAAGPGVVARVVGWAGLTDRLMFGSDWPPCTLEATYAQVCATARSLTADLSEAERHAIFSGTAHTTYRLP